MPENCYNFVSFTGENTDAVLEHFQKIENDNPLFSRISIYKDTVAFYSHWVPPLTELNLIAEQFDVSYFLEYRIPYEHQTSFEYICMQHQPLELAAEKIREIINKAETKAQFKEADKILDDLLITRELSFRELGLLACFLKKRITEIGRNNMRVQAPWESANPSTEKKRGR